MIDFQELLNNAVWCFFHLIAAIVVSVSAGKKWTCLAGGDGKLDFGAVSIHIAIFDLVAIL